MKPPCSLEVAAREALVPLRAIDVKHRDLCVVQGKPDHHRGVDVLRAHEVVVEFRAQQVGFRHPVVVGQHLGSPVGDVGGGIGHVVQWIDGGEVV